jgi:hypothetical protein
MPNTLPAAFGNEAVSGGRHGIQPRRRSMELIPIFLTLALVTGGGAAIAGTHSDYTKSFDLKTLETYDTSPT